MSTTIAGRRISLERTGKHHNLIFEYAEQSGPDEWDIIVYNYEELKDALPKLQALVKASEMLLES